MSKKILIATLVILSVIGIPFAIADESAEPEFKLKFQGDSQFLSLEDIGVTVEAQNSQVSLFHNFLNREEYSFSWDSEESEAKIREYFELSNPSHANFYIEGDELKLEGGMLAPEFDIEKLISSVTSNYPSGSSYKIKEIKWVPVTKEDLSPYYEFVKLLVAEGLKTNINGEEIRFPLQIKDLILSKTKDNFSFTLSEAYTAYVMQTLDELISYPAENLTILEIDLSELGFAKTEGHVRDGLKLDEYKTLVNLNQSIEKQTNEFEVMSNVEKGMLVNKSGVDLGQMKKIATGMSNFYGSPWGREYNIRRALNEYYNAFLIPADGEFSYVDLLGPVTYSAGWKASLAIFLGNELKEVAGGGLCQVSTTIYRAALDAGMEILDQRSHSLYVHYYDDYGDGLDATIYPGVQDLRFRNNTGHPILIETFDDGFDAVVNFYGTDDGRETIFEGPYTASNQPQEVVDAIGYLRYYELAWKYIIKWPDGNVEEEWLVSTYNSAVPQYKTNQ